MFSNLRQGSTIYILTKGDDVSLVIASVDVVGNKTPKLQTQTPGVGYGLNSEMVIDIKATSSDGRSYDFKQLPCQQSVANFGNAIISDNREEMIQEVDNIRMSSTKALNEVDFHKRAIASCESMLRTLNPVYAKEQDRDNAINELRERFDNLEDRISSALSNIEKAIVRSGKQKTE